MTLALIFHSSQIDHLLATWGYAAVFVLIGLESLGVPLPGETTLILAALYSGSTHNLSIGGVVAAAAAGAIVGDNAGYVIGRIGGHRLLQRYGKYVRVDARRLRIGRYLFDRHGGKVVFFGRFVSLLRTYAAFLAGTMEMHWRSFLIWNASGGIVWSCIYGFGYYQFGSALKKAQTPTDVAFGVAAVVAVAGGLWFLRRKEAQLDRASKEAYPNE